MTFTSNINCYVVGGVKCREQSTAENAYHGTQALQKADFRATSVPMMQKTLCSNSNPGLADYETQSASLDNYLENGLFMLAVLVLERGQLVEDTAERTTSL